MSKVSVVTHFKSRTTGQILLNLINIVLLEATADYYFYVEGEILIAMTMKTVVFWDVMPCSSLGRYQHSGGNWSSLFQGRRFGATKGEGMCF